jgi:phage/plasmid-like protein (TIGR03299 family)
MAHELNSSKDMFYVGETPWHGLGTKLEGRPTSEDAIKAANLDWEVSYKPLFAGTYAYEGTEAPQAVPGNQLVSHRATFKVGTGEILGVVGPNWHVYQNREAFKFFDPFIVSGQAAYETAGQLRGGKRVWILAEITGDPLVIVPKADDVIRRYILLSNAHDGTRAIFCGYTPIRVVCANTLSASVDSADSALLKVRHTKKAAEVVNNIGDSMNLINQTFEMTAKMYRELAAKGCDEATLKKYVNLVFAPRRVAKAVATKNAADLFVERTIAKALDKGEAHEETGLAAEELRSLVYPKIAELFEGGRGNDLPGVKGTLWAAYNSISEYIVHERGKDAASRLDGAWFGHGKVQNQRALKVGMELAKAA